MRFFVAVDFRTSDDGGTVEGTSDALIDEVERVRAALRNFGNVIDRDLDDSGHVLFALTLFPGVNDSRVRRRIERAVPRAVSEKRSIRRVSITTETPYGELDPAEVEEKEPLTRSAVKEVLRTAARVEKITETESGIEVILDVFARSDDKAVRSTVGALAKSGVNADVVADVHRGITSWHLLVRNACFIEDPVTQPGTDGVWVLHESGELSYHGVRLTFDENTGVVTVVLPADRPVLIRPNEASS